MGMRLIRIPGVYGPGRDSELLAAAIAREVEPEDRVLDVFTGSGVQAVTAARAGAKEVVAVDVSPRAALAARLNARLNGVGVRVLRGDMLEPVTGERFDLVVANPPFVPSVGRELPRGPALAWEGGTDGRRLLDPTIRGLRSVLGAGDRVLIVHSALCDVGRTIAMLGAVGIEAGVVERECAPLGPITAPRAAELERRGLLAPGERTEETVVVRGVAGPLAATNSGGARPLAVAAA